MQSILCAQFDDPSIRIVDTTVAEDIPNWDSIMHVRVIVAVEAHFGILFEPDEYMDFANVGEMVDCVCEKLGRKAASPGPAGSAIGA